MVSPNTSVANNSVEALSTSTLQDEEILLQAAADLQTWPAKLTFTLKGMTSPTDNILEYTGTIWKGHNLYFCPTKYPTNDEGFTSLKRDIQISALASGSNFVSNGRDYGRNSRRKDGSKREPVYLFMCSPTKKSASSTKKFCACKFQIKRDNFGYYLCGGIGNNIHKFHGPYNAEKLPARLQEKTILTPVEETLPYQRLEPLVKEIAGILREGDDDDDLASCEQFLKNFIVSIKAKRHSALLKKRRRKKEVATGRNEVAMGRFD
jgi:hypothetical protein